MLTHEELTTIADDLVEAEKNRTMIPRLTAQYPQMDIEDSYAVQRMFRERCEEQGRRVVGRKIGLTSKVMQEATDITEPDYGVIFADQVFENGSVIEHSQYSNVRIEAELAFVLKEDVQGPDVSVFDALRATEYVVPALEILSSRVEMEERRTIVDTISDNAALGAMVYGGRPVAPDSLDLRWVSALLYRNETIEDSGGAAAVLNHPAMGVVWLANKLAEHGDFLKAGEIILAGSFTKLMWVHAGDTVHADYGDLGAVTCRFV